MKTLTLLLLGMLLVSCGKEENPIPTDSHPNKIVAASSELPTCNDDSNGWLYYVSNEETFYGCNGANWTELSIKGDDGANGTNGTNGEDGEDGITISSRWRFHTDTYSGQPNIASEAGSAFLGTIWLVKFSDGSAIISTSGSIGEFDSNGDIYYQDFSHSVFIPYSDSEQSYVFKVAIYVNSRIRYRVNLSPSTPTFKAVIDSDGNFDNNTDSTYTLTAQ